MQGVCRAVCFQRPHFHLPETLTTELRLTTQRLLGNQAVGTSGTRVHLVVHQVVQLEHVHVTNGHRTLELVAGTAIEQHHLAAFWQVCQFQHGLDLALLGTIEDRCSHRHTFLQVVRQGQDLGVGELVEVFLTTTDLVVDLGQEYTQLSGFALLFEHAVDLLAQAFGRKAQVGFEDLTNVHTRRYAQRVQYDVDRSTVGVVRHVFNRHDNRDNTFVTVTAGHLVTRLDATADCQVNLDDLQYAWCQVIALLQLALLVFELVVQQTATVNDVLLSLFQLLVQCIFSHAQLEPLAVLQTIQYFVGDHGAFLQARATVDHLAVQGRTQTLEGCAFDDAELFVEVLADLVQLHLLDGQGAAVALHAITGEDLYVDDSALGAGWHAQGSVLNVAGFFAEDGAQQFFFRSQLGFAFWRNFTDQDVTRADFRTHVDDTGFVQLVQCGFTHVRDVRSDFLWAKLGITRHTGQFLNVDRGEAVFLHHTFGQADGVFEVEAVPRHESDTHVLTQCQLTHVGGRAVGHDVAALNLVTLADQRTLVDAGVLVGTGVLGQVVDVHTGFTGLDFIVIDPNDDTAGVDRVDHATAASNHADTGVTGNVALHAGTH